MRKLIITLTACAACIGVHAQVDWQQVERLADDSLSDALAEGRVDAQLISGSTWLTYSQMEDGHRAYYLVDRAGKRQPLLRDAAAYARQLRALTGEKNADADNLTFYGMTLQHNNPSAFYLTKHGRHLRYDRTTGRLDTISAPKEAGRHGSRFTDKRATTTDDGRYSMLGGNCNLYLLDHQSGDTLRLTTDGKEGASYTYRGKPGRISESLAQGQWHGHVYVTMLTDDSEVGNLYIIDAISGHRPVLHTKRMPLPNEAGVRRYRLWWYDADRRESRFLPIEKWRGARIDLAYTGASDTLWFTRRNRRADSLELCRVDVATGKVATVIQEVVEPHLNVNLQNWRFVAGGKRILWWSERTGRGNYYLYDLDGRLLNRVTRGDRLVAGRVDYVDDRRREIVFLGYGEEKGVCPTYTYYYRASFDGHRQQLLTPGNGEHELQWSTDHTVALDTYSRMDLPPVYQMVDMERGTVHEFARASDEALRARGWRRPVLVMVPAADGKTPLYGVMYLPAKMDSTRKYPIISNVYPGPQDDQVPRTFSPNDYGNQQLADLGFVVINVAPRGSGPLRGRDFYCFSYGNLRDYPLADDKHTIETLARRYPFIDLSRVGIYGHSGGGFMTATAMMTYPDFYKVGVAASGNYDNNNYIQWWGETFHGFTQLDSIPTTMQLADRLKGHLMLISGDEDNEVPWASTLRLADALQRAGKRFDMMVLPGKDHGVESPYYFNLIRYYFLEHLVKPEAVDMDIIKHQ